MTTRLLLILVLAFLAAAVAHAQDTPDGSPLPVPTVAQAPESPALAQSPAIKPIPVASGAAATLPKGAKTVKPEVKDKLQELLIEQGQKVIAIQNNELAYRQAKDKLEGEKADVDARLQTAAQEAAREQKIDLAKFLLDVKKWLWIPIEK